MKALRGSSRPRKRVGMNPSIRLLIHFFILLSSFSINPVNPVKKLVPAKAGISRDKLLEKLKAPNPHISQTVCEFVAAKPFSRLFVASGLPRMGFAATKREMPHSTKN